MIMKMMMKERKFSSHIPFRCFTTCLAFSVKASPVSADVMAFNDWDLFC